MRKGSVPDWSTLQKTIAGQVALPGSPLYERHSKPFNARFHSVRPKGIVLCATPQDVAETLSILHRHGLENAIRCGGHCLGGHSSTSGVVIDVTPMDAVSVAGEVATVSAGARLGAVYEVLQKQGVTMRAGTCPAVGIAGLTLGGGLGILGRKYGVTADRLMGAQIVRADGRILDCDEGHHQDLFWALRGAGGGNFGVVTSLVSQTVPVSEVTNFHLAWPFGAAVDVTNAWQRWAPTGPDELAASLKVNATGDVDQPPSVDVYGALIGTESDAASLLDDLVVRSGPEPILTMSKQMTFEETRRFWAHLGVAEEMAAEGQPPDGAQRPYLFAKSEFFGRPLPMEAIEALVQNFACGRISGESRELDCMPWGGAYNRVRPDATAFVHRRELFQIKHAGIVDPRG